MLVSFTIITALSAVFAERGIKAAGSAVVAFLFIFFGFYDIAFTPLSIAYPVEILPFRLRAKGLSINLTVVFGAGFFNREYHYFSKTIIKLDSADFFRIRQPNSSRGHSLEVLFRLHCHLGCNDPNYLLFLSGDQGSHVGRNSCGL